jgi:hypothetical protein
VSDIPLFGGGRGSWEQESIVPFPPTPSDPPEGVVFSPGLIDGILGYYPCDETSGYVINDVTGNGRHLTVTSPSTGIATSAFGKVGATSFSWQGASGTASRTDPAFLPGNAVSVMMWVRINPTTGNQTYIGVGTNGLVGAEPWRLRKDSGQNRYQFQIRGGGTTVVGSRTAQGVLVPNTDDWVLLIGGYNQAESKVWLSENGGPKVVTNVSPSDYWPVRQDYTTLHVGSMNGTDWSRSFMNEFGIWERELTDADIAELWNSTNGKFFNTMSGGLGPVTSTFRSQHDSNALTWGAYVSDSLVGTTVDQGKRFDNVDYDAARVFFDLYDRTADTQWLTAAQRAIVVYRDQWVAPLFAAASYPLGGQQWPHGLYQDYIRNGTAASLTALNDMATKGELTRAGAVLSSSVSTANSRRVACAISTLILHEKTGGTRHSKFLDFISQAVEHVRRWCIEETAPFMRPFEVGLTCEALIEAYEYLKSDPTQDNLCAEMLYALSIASEFVWERCYVSTDKVFTYADRDTGNSFDLLPSRNLAMLMAPLYAWLWRNRQQSECTTQAILLIEGANPVYSSGTYVSGANFGTPSATGVVGRVFVQNYRWTRLMWQCLDAKFLRAKKAEKIVPIGIAGDSAQITPSDEDMPNALRRLLGSKPNFYQFYRFFPKKNFGTDSVSPWRGSLMTQLIANNIIPIISWEPWRFNNLGQKEGVPLEDFLDGSYDPWLEDWAVRCRALEVPIIVRFAHEMNGFFSAQDGYWWAELLYSDADADTPNRYKQMWRYVIGKFRSLGAYNVFFPWCVNRNSVGPGSPKPAWNNMAAFWPGAEWVDMIGLDAYSGKHSPFVSFDSMVAATVSELNAISGINTSTLPWLLYEVNRYEDGIGWRDWFLDACRSCEERNWGLVIFHVPSKEWFVRERFTKHPKSFFARNGEGFTLPPVQYETTSYASWGKNGQVVTRDGHPFFAMGWYYTSDYSAYNEAEVDALFDAGTNLIYAPVDMNSPLIEHVERRGGAMLIEMNSGDPNGVVTQYKDRPHVLGYYTYDDIDNYTANQVQTASNARKAIAPNKLTYGSGGFSPSFGSTYSGKVDILAFQNYPIGNVPDGCFGSWNDYLTWVAPAANAAGQCWWANPQGFSWKGNPQIRYPNITEMRNCHWQPVMLGATGLLYYAAYSAQNPWTSDATSATRGTDQRPDLQTGWMAEWSQLAKETRELQAYFTYGTRSILTTTASTRNAAAMWTLQNKRLIIALNFRDVGTGHNGTCSITVPSGLSGKTAPYSGRYGDGFTLSGTTLSGTLNESQVRIFILNA